jgi:isocitrate dehydrogenase kinase/phosphatase
MVLAIQGAQAIQAGFEAYQARFKEITRRAKDRFESRDWRGAQRDAVERLDLYAEVIWQVVQEVQSLLQEDTLSQPVWAQMKACYSQLIAGRDDFELAETFFNSVTRRIFATVGVDREIEFVDSDFEALPERSAGCVYQVYTLEEDTWKLLLSVLGDYRFGVPFADLERDARLAAGAIDAHIQESWGGGDYEKIDFIRSVFYRGKGAYLVGRIHRRGELCPVILALLNTPEGILVDAALLTWNDTSIIFSYARSYFHVEVKVPHELISFLHSIMPHKRIAELYISIGYNKHGKTELYRDLLRHLEHSNDKFEIARGERGMVMAVFTLPSYDMVFKVIKDKFAEPKNTTRRDVMEHYQLVFKHDRAGRLIDAQEFEHIKFDRSRFSDELTRELLEHAPSSVRLENEAVVIDHLYTERRTIPLDIFVREAGEAAVQDAVLDYGQAIKDMAATNIFPGDILLKNFGVTRNGRVVFYDYDELTLLTECKFRRIPPPSSFQEEYESEPWFFVGKNDIFPEEFRTFLGLMGTYRELFIDHHSDLFSVEFWRMMQKRHEAGEVMDIFPYRENKRLQTRREPDLKSSQS